MDDVTINKAAIIERSIRRVREEYQGDPANLTHSLTKQDSIVRNIQRACEASIDLAMHIVRKKRLGVPQDSREAFDLLERDSFIDPVLAAAMKKMVSFRNIAVHEYQSLDLSIVLAVIDRGLDDLLRFSGTAVRSLSPTRNG
jgi:uncharacterized protein YutE (UPF0331/DUF86 family)